MFLRLEIGTAVVEKSNLLNSDLYIRDIVGGE